MDYQHESLGRDIVSPCCDNPKRSRILLFLILLVIGTEVPASAQVTEDWVVYLPGKDPDLAVANDGTVCVARIVGTAVVTTCLDSNGAILWEGFFEPQPAAYEWSLKAYVRMDSDANIYVFSQRVHGGATGSSSHYDIQKHTLDGDSLWTATYSFNQPNALIADVEVDAEGNSYLLAADQPDTVTVMLTAKFGYFGSLQWAKRFRSPEPGAHLRPGGDNAGVRLGSLTLGGGYVYVAGWGITDVCGDGTKLEIVLLKYNQLGNLAEGPTYYAAGPPKPCGTTQGQLWPRDLVVDDSDRLYVASRRVDWGAGDYGVLSRFNSFLVEDWTLRLDSSMPERLVLLNEGTLLVAAENQILKYGFDGALLELNECHSGDASCTTPFYGDGFGGSWPVVDGSDNTYVAHHTALRSYDKDLDVRWNYRLPGDSSPIHGLGVDINGLVYVTGRSPGQIFVARYKQPQIGTGVKDPHTRPAGAYELGVNHPNPSKTTTTISYRLPQAATVQLTVHDVLGRTVRVLASERQAAGVHEVQVDTASLSSGVYFCRFVADDYTKTRKLVVTK